MHGYDIGGMPGLQPPLGSMAQMETGSHHPDSTDSYVTFGNSEDEDSSMAASP